MAVRGEREGPLPLLLLTIITITTTSSVPSCPPLKRSRPTRHLGDNLRSTSLTCVTSPAQLSALASSPVSARIVDRQSVVIRSSRRVHRPAAPGRGFAVPSGYCQATCLQVTKSCHRSNAFCHCLLRLVVIELAGAKAAARSHLRHCRT